MQPDMKMVCDELGLTSISVALSMRVSKRPYAAYLHWNDGSSEEERDVASGYGDTPDEAIASAQAEMAERRKPRASRSDLSHQQEKEAV